MARVMADMMALRTAAIDAAIRDAIAGGATQLVILGAGYDGRAWRMPELAGVKVFEVDHPATQGDKRTHLEELPPATGNVTFPRSTSSGSHWTPHSNALDPIARRQPVGAGKA